MAAIFVNLVAIKSFDSPRFADLQTGSVHPRSFRPIINQNRRVLVVKASESKNEWPIKKTQMSDAECEAAVVAGNAPFAPPVPPVPASPSGTPVVSPLVSFIKSFVSFSFNVLCVIDGIAF